MKKAAEHQARMVEKYFHTQDGSFPLGQILSMSSPKGAQKFKTWSSDFVDSVKKGFKNGKWKLRKYRKAVVLEGFWDQGNRFYKYFIWEDNGRFHYSLASSRIVYADKFYYESEVFQRLLYFKNNQISQVKTVWNQIKNFIISDAHAQQACNCAPSDFMCRLLCASPIGGGNFGEGGTTEGVGGGGVGGGLGGILGGGDEGGGFLNFGGLMNEIGALRGDVQTLNATADLRWGESNEIMDRRWGESNEITDRRWGESNEIMDRRWGETNHQMEMFRQMMDTNWRESNEIMDQRWAETNQIIEEQWSETNAIAREGMERTTAIMERALDPKHAFVLAAATGAGAALGATAVNLVVDGIAFGLKQLVALFQSDMSDQEKIALFQSAIENYEQNNSTLRKLENALDTLPLMMLASQTFQGFNEDSLYTLRELEKEKRHMQRGLRKLEDEVAAVENSGLSEENKHVCIDSIYDQQLDIEEDIEEIERIVQFMENNGDLANGFCSNMQNIWRQYIDAEAAMTRLRRILSTPDLQENFLQAIDEQFEQSRNRNEDIADRNAGRNLANDIQNRAERSRNRALNQLEGAQRQLLRQCSHAISRNVNRSRTSSQLIDHNCGQLFEDYHNLESRQSLTGQSREEIYAYFLNHYYPNLAEDKKTRLITTLNEELNILGRLENFQTWREEIQSAYDRKVESAGSYEEFMRPFKADLIRIDENVHGYQLEAYLDWFKQIASDMDERERNLTSKMEERSNLLQQLCPATHYRWSSHLNN